MKTLWKVLKIVGGLLVVAAVALVGYVSVTWDKVWDVPAPDLRASTDPVAIARGEYLVFGPAHCVECHVSDYEGSHRILAEGGKPPLVGGYPLSLGPLGVLYTRNLTPDPETGMGRYTDGQVARMLRHGVRPDGIASLPVMMPFSDMSDEDIVGILSYLRSQPPVRNEVPPNEWTLLGKVVKSFAAVAKPKLDGRPPKVSPPQEPTVARGEYLARSVANCGGCHSPYDLNTGALVGPLFSGGFAMEPAPLPGVDKTVWFKPPNLSPRPGSALLRFPDRATFVARFKVGGKKYEGSPMPWTVFARMDEADIGALYEFLHTLEPVGEADPAEPTEKQ